MSGRVCIERCHGQACPNHPRCLALSLIRASNAPTMPGMPTRIEVCYGQFAIGPSAPAFKTQAAARRGAMLTILCCPGSHPAMCCARLTRMPEYARSTPRGEGRAGRAGGADRRRLDQVRLGRPAAAGHRQAPQRLAELPAALPGAGEGPCPLHRRLCRLCRRRDQEPGHGCRRADRGQYEPLPPRSALATPRTGRAARLGELQDNICFTAILGDKAATEAAFAKAAHIVKHRLVINRVTTARWSRAAGRRLQRHHRPLHDLHHAAARHPYRAELASSCSRCRSTRCASSPPTSAAASA